ncbi:MAG: EAL domain-containing protein [Candidatus Competibacteraceae bacterium]|jgi:diguanylate cyclase (GGDEF)-like protein|nr:EAL domain-containing protein [Candidatus Competibacteraceae bacterium]
MRLEITPFHSKIGRRIFLFFILSSLVPVGLFSAISLNKISTVLNEKVLQQLHATSKNYGMLLYDRLLFLEAEITRVADSLNKEILEKNQLDKEVNERFKTFMIASVTDDQIVLPSSQKKIFLSKPQIDHLAQENSLLLSVISENYQAQVFLFKLLNSPNKKHSILIGEIRRDYLWENGDILEPATSLCILNQFNDAIHCASGEASWLPKSLNEQLAVPSSGSIDWDINNKKAIVYYWSIFTEPRFFTSYWTVITTQPAIEARASVTDFLRTYSAVIVLAILSVLFLSIKTIRKTLLPLEALMSGIQRVSRGEFTEQVKVHSHDEFELLGASFNEMSGLLSKKIKILQTMAEIDRLILGRFTVRNVVDFVLTHFQELVPCDRVGMLILEEVNNGSSRLFVADQGSHDKSSSFEVKVSDQQIDELIENRNYLLHRADNKINSYLTPMEETNICRFFLLPIMVEENLVAVICIAYKHVQNISDSDIALGREFSDRIAIGLSKSSWEKKLYHQAHYDALTNLPNRLLVTDRLNQAISRAKRYNTCTAVMFIDIDQFKKINDSLGHNAGDLLLKELAQRLPQSIRRSDTVGRLSGDEFIVVIPDTDKQKALSTTITVAEKILAKLAAPFVLNDNSLRVTASIGIAIQPRDGVTIDDLMKNADTAMYHAKAKGRNNYQFYAKELNATAFARLQLESQLHRALERDEFELYYQPQIDILSGRIVAAEALLRWQNPAEGWIGPDQFIPIAEETGLILPIGEWVFRKACKDIKSICELGFSTGVAVNISALQFRNPQLLVTIRQAIEDSALEPQNLEIEVTETTAMQGLEESLALLNQMREMGLRIAIDDFGTGHSSLAYLKRFPVHTLKIDRSFVQNLGVSQKDEAIINSILALAHNLGLDVVAEGVETTEQLQYLRQYRCEKFQGYLFSRPLPLDEFIALLIKHQDRVVEF